ncbi:hypothetical protein HYV79_02405 [Candidatus Woesearchaeota archaeon]|nr:hypothetical protein [Candidatus Woesearchaeota archaeon]
MFPKVKEDIISVLLQSINELKAGKYHELSELSNHVIHDASIYQDNDSLSVAILVYALSKVVQRCCEQKIDYTQFYPPLETAIIALKKEQYGSYNKSIEKIFRLIEKTDARLKLYIQEVIDKAKIKKGQKLHEHGLSVGRTAEMLGITQWELLNYIGKTSIKIPKELISIQKRLEFTRDLFK